MCIRDRSDRDLILRTERFSHFAIWAVPFLFVTGLYLLWRLNGNLLDIGSTLYERLLMVKLVAALILLGAGAFNKFRIGILLQQSPLVGRAALRKSLGLEAVLFLFVLLCVLWATTVTGPNGHSH